MHSPELKKVCVPFLGGGCEVSSRLELGIS